MQLRYNTHDNHFQFGWGQGQFNFEHKHLDYWATFGRAKYFPTSFKQECNRAAYLIKENAVKPLMLFFSGGVDSEIVARALLEVGAKFEVAIMKVKYKDNNHYNKFDTKYAYNFCSIHKLKVNEITMDVEKAMLTYIKDVAHTYSTHKFGVIMQHEMIRYFPNHHIVYGGGDIKLTRYKSIGIDRPGLCVIEGPIAVQALEVAETVGSEVSDRFFCHTPELMLSWLLEPDIQHWIKYEKALYSFFGDINNHGIKSFVLYKHWPEMEIRPKLNGFERIGFLNDDKKLNDEVTSTFRELRSLYKDNLDKCVLIDYHSLYSMLIPK